MSVFEIKKDSFFLDGEPFRIMSGAIHYFRTLPECWDDRLEKLKAAGLNTVETYVAWNMHEKREGEFCFDGICDIEKFIRMAGEKGLKVIVRPSPYICAEWEFGGFPAWLLREPTIALRTSDPVYLDKIRAYYRQLIPRLASLQCTRGGPVIMMQIENEYGSYGSDREYLRFLATQLRENGVDVPLFTSDGETNYFLFTGTLPEEFKTVNFFSENMDEMFRDIRQMQPQLPLMVGEFWGGWYDHWGEAHSGRSAEEFRRAFEALLQTGASFNLYMFHGGTNFGFMNGANHTDTEFQPDVTSYDYDCMLTEQGEPTEKYWIVRELCEKYTGKKAPQLTVPANPAVSYGKVKLTQYGSIFDQLSVMGVRHCSTETRTMEQYGQNYGYILYRTRLPRYGENEISINKPHDLAYVFVNGKYAGRVWRNDESKKLKVNFDRDENLLEILVENFGRVNYGRFLHDRKGISENVTIGIKLIMDWEVFCLEMEEPQKAVLTDTLPEKTDVHGFLQGSFFVDEPRDTFLSTETLSVGQVFINGFNLGRYWTKAGPQQTLYVPAPLLRAGENSILIFENEAVESFCVELIDHAKLS